MKAVFADTAFFLALTNPRDQYHHAAVEIREHIDAPLVTTAWVLLEYANAVAGSRGRRGFAVLLGIYAQRAMPESLMRIPPFESGCTLYTSRPDKEWSLPDCVSFVVMNREGLKDSLTSDRHFEQAGFNALLIR